MNPASTARLPRASVLRQLLARRQGSGETEGQTGRCPVCLKPLYSYLSEDGPAWTCQCAGPEQAHYEALRLATRSLKKGRRR